MEGLAWEAALTLPTLPPGLQLRLPKIGRRPRDHPYRRDVYFYKWTPPVDDRSARPL